MIVIPLHRNLLCIVFALSFGFAGCSKKTSVETPSPQPAVQAGPAANTSSVNPIDQSQEYSPPYDSSKSCEIPRFEDLPPPAESEIVTAIRFYHCDTKAFDIHYYSRATDTIPELRGIFTITPTESIAVEPLQILNANHLRISRLLLEQQESNFEGPPSNLVACYRYAPTDDSLNETGHSCVNLSLWSDHQAQEISNQVRQSLKRVIDHFVNNLYPSIRSTHRAESEQQAREQATQGQLVAEALNPTTGLRGPRQLPEPSSTQTPVR